MQPQPIRILFAEKEEGSETMYFVRADCPPQQPDSEYLHRQSGTIWKLVGELLGARGRPPDIELIFLDRMFGQGILQDGMVLELICR